MIANRYSFNLMECKISLVDKYEKFYNNRFKKNKEKKNTKTLNTHKSM